MASGSRAVDRRLNRQFGYLKCIWVERCCLLFCSVFIQNKTKSKHGNVASWFVYDLCRAITGSVSA